MDDKGNTRKPCIVTQKEDYTSLESTYVLMWVGAPLSLPTTCLVSQATPFAERKGLVTLQLTSCCRGTQLSNSVWSDNKMLTSAKHVVM